MKKIAICLICLACLLLSPGFGLGNQTTKVSGGFKIISPEFNFSDKQKFMEIEYWLNDYQPANADDVLYLGVLKLNTAVWPLPDWVDKTYYLTQRRYEEIFDQEFNTMFNESEAQTYTLTLPKKSEEKLSFKVDVDPYCDYLVSLSFIKDKDNNFKTGYKLIGGNYLELTPRPDIRSEMEKITKTGATIVCLPQMFSATKKDKADVILEVFDMQSGKPTTPPILTKKSSIVAIKNSNQTPPWNKPDYITFEITGLAPNHSYMAKITSKMPTRTTFAQKMFLTLK